MNTSVCGGILCGYCGRPMLAGVNIGGRMYHEECTRGPGYRPHEYKPMPQAPGCTPANQLTEGDVRRIVRDEMSRVPNVKVSGCPPNETNKE